MLARMSSSSSLLLLASMLLFTSISAHPTGDPKKCKPQTVFPPPPAETQPTTSIPKYTNTEQPPPAAPTQPANTGPSPAQVTPTSTGSGGGGSLDTWGTPVPGPPPVAVPGEYCPEPMKSKGPNPPCVMPPVSLSPGSGWASTTTYQDGGKNGCGCLISDKDFGMKVKDGYTLYQAAGSSAFFGQSTWLGKGCGTCYNLTSYVSFLSCGHPASDLY